MSSSQDNRPSSSPLALLALALSMLLSSIGISIPNVGLPTLAGVFSVSISEVQWVILAYLLAVTTLIVPAGRLGDTIGRQRVLAFGISLFTLSALLAGMAPTLWFLVVARAMQGLGAATLMALTVASVSEAVAKEKLGRAMGLLGTMSAVGTATGPTIGGLLITSFGWRSIFLSMVPVGALALFLIRRYLVTSTERQRVDSRQFDPLGVLLLGVALASYALAMTIGGGHLTKINATLVLLAGASGALFLWNESRAHSPLLRRELLRDRDMLLNLVMNGLVSSVVMSTLVVGPFYLSQGLELDMATVGLVMSAGPVTSAISGFPAGRLVDRLGASAVTVLGLAELALGALAMSWLPQLYGVPGYIASAMLMSPGYQMFQAANNATVMSKVSSGQRGVVSGMLSLSRNLGLITGTAVMGAIFATRGASATFSSAAVLALVTLAFAIASIAWPAADCGQR